MKRVMIAAPSSGSGKTTLTCGLLRVFQNRKIEVGSFKCGPDYIDPMFHKEVLCVPSANLDLFLQTPEQALGLFLKNSRELSVLEGVMGYYDGIGSTDCASSHHLATLTKTPVLLVVSPKGQSLSVAALIKGFLEFRRDSMICGVILNPCSKPLHDLLKPAIEALGVPVLGFVPKMDEIALESRHLGLVTAGEVQNMEEKLSLLAKTLEETVDIDAILELAAKAPPLFGTHHPEQPLAEKRVVAVAMDKAFCFYYQDNLDVLREMGCDIVFFSPLKDKALPKHTNCLYMGGGYPELYAKELSENNEMLKALQVAAQNGVPMLAECGGFMYLMQDIAGEKMVGALKGSSHNKGRLTRFGYVAVSPNEDTPFLKKGEQVKAHEFHHWDSDQNGMACTATKPISGRTWACMRSEGAILAGFPHLYFRSCPQMIRRFLTCGA